MLQNFWVWFALFGDIYLGCHSRLLPKRTPLGHPQPLHDVAMLANIKGKLFDLECDMWEERPQLGKTSQIAPTAAVGMYRYAGTLSLQAVRLGRGRAAVMAVGFCARDASEGADCSESCPQPFYMVIRRPEWGRLRGLLTPPAQSSQQLLSQVPANRSTCLWSQSGLSGDRAPFPRLIGVRGAKNFTLFFFFPSLFKAGYKPLVFLLLLWVCFSASFPPPPPPR